MNLDDVHLCIKCNTTIAGLENYIAHRKHNCSTLLVTSTPANTATNATRSHESIVSSSTVNLDHTYNSYTFTEPEPPSTHADKASKTSLTESYELPYELGADVFFSSLQLQSVQSIGHVGGKTSSTQQSQMQRNKSQSDQAETWMTSHSSTSNQHNSDTLMKAVHDISGTKKPYESLFKTLSFAHDSPDGSEDEIEHDDVDDVDDDVADDDDDDEDYDPGTSTKWKLSVLRHSPPVVPITHTGGKWKPEHRPNLRAGHSQLMHLSPHWDYPNDEASEMRTVPPSPQHQLKTEQHPPADHTKGKWLPASDDTQHPPADHTKGKWLPGSKLQRLEYKKKVKKAKTIIREFWCNICCRKLKSKAIYEHHLRTSYHLKRLESEQLLEKANISALPTTELHKSLTPLTTIITETETETEAVAKSIKPKKRLRRSKFFKCELCRNVVVRHLIGKHLISHYHYRRVQLNPVKSLRMVLDNMHSIVMQSPFQCLPCRFFANTEQTFLQHWNSPEHLDKTEGSGVFWCSFCRFECEDNNQMRRHLLCSEHKEVLMAINRSVPVCIRKRLIISCPKCRKTFRYNFELRQHIISEHDGMLDVISTGSDVYQCRFKCSTCSECFHTKIALQRHEKYAHSLSKYFCSICHIEFATPCQARRHRKSQEHRMRSSNQISNPGSTEQYQKQIEKFKAVLQHKANIKKSATHNPIKTNDTSKKLSTNADNKLVMVQPKRVFKCRLCMKKFSTTAELRVHKNSYHDGLEYACISCGENFRTPQALGRHTRNCEPLPLSVPLPTTPETVSCKWTCDECQMGFNYESELLYHRLHHTYGSITKNQLIKCPLCKKSFRKHSLRCHLRQHTNEKIYDCEFCHIKFARRYNLKQHVKNLHTPKEEQQQAKKTIADDTSNVRIYECSTCNKTFSSKYTLKQHNLSHGAGDERERFDCSHPNCNYIAYSKGTLKVHLLTHSQELFKCEHNDCNYIGKSLHHLKRHSQVHTIPNTLFSCDQCDFQARHKIHLQRHQQRQHTTEKLHKCPHCDFYCKTIDNLRKHVLKTSKHPGKFMFECRQCQCQSNDEANSKVTIAFKTNSYRELQLHMQQEHK